MNIGKFLKESRISKGMSQQELADKAKVTKRAINYWENDDRKMSLESADKVFSALEVTLTIGNNNQKGRHHESNIKISRK